MEERVKTSFIPKASLSVERKQAPRGNPVALANVIAAVVLVLAIVGAGGIFLFERFTLENIEAKRASLERSRAAFEPATIKELSRLDTRIEAGGELLSQHLSLSKLFDELERLTLSSVRFGSFLYETTGLEKTLLNANGQAASFNAVALQSGGFSKSNIITEPIFSNVNIGESGGINFDFSAVINSERLNYIGTNNEDNTQSPSNTQAFPENVAPKESNTIPDAQSI